MVPTKGWRDNGLGYGFLFLEGSCCQRKYFGLGFWFCCLCWVGFFFCLSFFCIAAQEASSPSVILNSDVCCLIILPLITFAEQTSLRLQKNIFADCSVLCYSSAELLC